MAVKGAETTEDHVDLGNPLPQTILVLGVKKAWSDDADRRIAGHLAETFGVVVSQENAVEAGKGEEAGHKGPARSPGCPQYQYFQGSPLKEIGVTGFPPFQGDTGPFPSRYPALPDNHDRHAGGKEGRQQNCSCSPSKHKSIISEKRGWLASL